MSDRMAVMQHGRIEQVGPKLDVYARPASRFVASFLGNANRIEGRLGEADGNVAPLDWNGVTVLVPRPQGAGGGARIDYFIKSERIAIGAPGSERLPRDAVNRLGGTLRDVIFKGQYADYFVELQNGAELVVSAATVLSEIKPREPVEIAWPPEAGDAFRSA
jgi:ABC-type Fe3+/spermidine/putrescine transport system ATPase subunit